MEYTRLGSSGLEISRIVLGCMGFGDPGQRERPWVVDQDETRALIRQALEAGITTFDTANVYSQGQSEEYVGRALGDMARRDQVIICTKVNGRMGTGPNDAGLSRGAIMAQVEASLRRLGTDYIDLYQIHRYDHHVPIEETQRALDDLVRQGKVRYIGASSMDTWRFVQAQYLADAAGLTRFVSMQDQYNLLMREEEREMHPFCQAEGVGVLTWSPLARGRLTRPWEATTQRGQTDTFGATLYHQREESDRHIVGAVMSVATRLGVSPAQVALAWQLSKPAVSAPIVGVTRPQHLSDAVASLGVHLDPGDIAEVEAHYAPHAPEGY